MFLTALSVYLTDYSVSYAGSELRGTTIEVQVSQTANVGEAVPLKIKKAQNEKNVPKVYFNKTKLALFLLPDSWYRCLIPLSANLKPGEYPIEIYYNSKSKKSNLIVKPTDYPVEEITFTKEVAGIRATKTERNLVGKAINTLSDKKFWSGKFILPNKARTSTIYGVRRKINGILDPDNFHKGLDFAAQEGENVISPEAGKIVLVGLVSMDFAANGNSIFIDHGHGVVSGYLHLSSVLVKEGDIVNKGQIIGKVGSTGIATGPHLHWGLYVLGKTVDPFIWTKKLIE